MTLEPDEVADLVAAVQLGEAQGAFTAARANRLRSLVYFAGRRPAVFRLHPDCPRLYVDGVPLQATLGALALWRILDAHQRAAAPLYAADLWPDRRNPSACATQALRSLVPTLARLSLPLASIAAGVGTIRGVLALPRDAGLLAQVRADLISA